MAHFFIDNVWLVIATMRPLLLVLFVTLTLFGLLAVSNVQRALAAPIVSLDASSASQLDAAPATSLTTGRTARVGVVVTGVSSTAPLSNVFGWQFTINYATAAVTAQADPALATDPLGTACTIDVDCSEASDATVKFGA